MPKQLKGLSFGTLLYARTFATGCWIVTPAVLGRIFHHPYNQGAHPAGDLRTGPQFQGDTGEEKLLEFDAIPRACRCFRHTEGGRLLLQGVVPTGIAAAPRRRRENMSPPALVRVILSWLRWAAVASM